MTHLHALYLALFSLSETDKGKCIFWFSGCAWGMHPHVGKKTLSRAEPQRKNLSASASLREKKHKYAIAGFHGVWEKEKNHNAHIS
jgi:hypothetical protein